MSNMPIIYEDADLLVVNKPAGIVVNDAHTVKEPTVQSWFKEYLSGMSVSSSGSTSLTDGAGAVEWQNLIPAEFTGEFGQPQEIWQERQGIVHRLDKDTSGAMVLAKNPGALVNLLHQFKQRQTTKKYLCLTHGKFAVAADTITAPLARASYNRLQFSVSPEGRPASTKYQVVEYYPHLDVPAIIQLPAAEGSNFKKRAQMYQGFSLVECEPKTGRTHQIRVHLAHLKHPLVGDATYAGKKRQALDPIWCPRQFLHAQSLEIHHPRTGQALTFEAPLTADLQSVLAFLLRD